MRREIPFADDVGVFRPDLPIHQHVGVLRARIGVTPGAGEGISRKQLVDTDGQKESLSYSAY